MEIQPGRLELIHVREIWRTEDGDFTHWLAEPDNLVRLGEAIGLELELEGMEHRVGPFRADIVCKHNLTGTRVLIENQLEKTDHGHLGQLLTYAAGCDAIAIVWIAGSFIPEHRSALDWLNKITDDRFSFYGVEVEAWRIGESVAPTFTVVSQPGNTTVSTRRPAVECLSKQRSSTKHAPGHAKPYWIAFKQVLKANPGPLFAGAVPSTNNWYGFSTGHPDCPLFATAYAGSPRSIPFLEGRPDVRVDLNLRGNDRLRYFRSLHMQKDGIEAELGYDLEWHELRDQQISRIILRKPNTDIEDRADWPAQHQWLLEKLKDFHRVFAPRVQQL